MKPPAPATSRPALVPALRAALAERWRHYRLEWRACQREFHPSSVHESRVATRRLRATLEFLGDVLDTRGLGRARRVLKRHLAGFAPLREAQAQRALLPQLRLPADLAGDFDRFLHRREARAARRARHQLTRLKPRRVARFVARLDRQLESSPTALDAPQLARALARHARRLRTLQRRAQTPRPEPLHTLRVALKRYRYTVEWLAPLLAPGPARELAMLKELQARLGAAQDACVTVAWFAEFAAEQALPPERAQPVAHRLERRLDRALARAGHAAKALALPAH